MKRISTNLIPVLGCALLLTAALSEDILRLRNVGLAELENEQPARAEEIFRDLVSKVPGDRLPNANLAVALLRQQSFEEALTAIERALEIAPDDPELLSIQGEILQWSGAPDRALSIFRRAAARAPEMVEIQYALFRQASTLQGPESETARREALDRLRELRPDNLVIQLQFGQQRVAAGDRTGATEAFLRVEEILWQAPPAATTLIEQILAALEADDLESARVPALRLENVLKITPMFKEGLRELSPGIQGFPVQRFREEPEATSFGDPVPVRFAAAVLADSPTAPRGLAIGDFDGDLRSDWARLTVGQARVLEIWQAQQAGEPVRSPVPSKLDRLFAADIDNDGHLDLVGHGAGALEVFRGVGDGRFELSTAIFGLTDAGAVAATVLDFDIEGDLDLATAGGRSGTMELFRNSLQGALTAVGQLSLPSLSLDEVRDLIASDLDRDGDVDLLLAHDSGLTWLDNLRQGQFADRTRAAGLATAGPAAAVAAADLDNDGFPDLVMAHRGLSLLRNRRGTFQPWAIDSPLRADIELSAVVVFDANNDGRLDLAAAGPTGVILAVQDREGSFRLQPIDGAPPATSVLAAADLDQDCDLDLLAGGPAGLYRLENQGGDKNHCLTVELRGLTTGNSKNNHFGVGSTLEVRAGRAYQFREVTSDLTHFGIGGLARADLLRVVWTNGVPQNRLQPEARQRIVEEQVLKGSCPFLYAWNGREVRFVTDLLWGAPAGLPVAPGVWATADPQELVKVEGARPIDGRYELKVTEELWEAAFFDFLRLWIVDHPADTEVASSLRIVPGEIIDDRVLATRELRGVRAFSELGEDLTDRVAARDEVYADVWTKGPYQGVAAMPWSLELDLGEAPARPVRLHLDGWIFPTDASLNLALAQRSDQETWPPRLEVATEEGWRPLLQAMGHPAGKTKTMVVDTPALPAGAHRLRIVGTQWLAFDRIAWSTEPADDEPVVRARLAPVVADLHFRGFSRVFRAAPNGPHYFDYSQVRTESPWLPFPGRYTRYGDVRELLEHPDDRSVIMAPGDEIALVFDARTLPPPAPGWQRSVLLESHGWDKDADRNTWEAQQMEPLPFRAMDGYPSSAGAEFPDDASHRDYRRRWLTRLVTPVPGILPSRQQAP